MDSARKPLSETATRILDVAERMARQGGYNSFSFRDIAGEIGIKSASIHYHFPTKEDLAELMVCRYTDRFLDALGAPDAAGPQEMLERYVAVYRTALVEQQLMCLCGVFGAEIATLPEPVSRRTHEFFDRNLDWLDVVFQAAGVEDPRKKSGETIARLEGAMILAHAMDDMDLFRRITQDIAVESLQH